MDLLICSPILIINNKKVERYDERWRRPRAPHLAAHGAHRRLGRLILARRLLLGLLGTQLGGPAQGPLGTGTMGLLITAPCCSHPSSLSGPGLRVRSQQGAPSSTNRCRRCTRVRWPRHSNGLSQGAEVGAFLGFGKRFEPNHTDLPRLLPDR